MKGKPLALILLACLLLSSVSCGQGPLEKSRAWLQKGELDKARAALEDSLAKQPDWHEARALLVEVELAAGVSKVALDHMLILFRADYDTSALEQNLYAALDKCTYQQISDCILYILDNESSWGQGLALHVLNQRPKNSELITAVLPPLVKVTPEQQWPLEIWNNYLAKDPISAWQLSADLPGEFRQQIILYLVSMNPEEQKEIETQLHEIDGAYPGLTGTVASQLEEVLRKEDTDFSPSDPSSYSQNKLSLLLEANPEEVDSRHLRWLKPDDIANRINNDLWSAYNSGSLFMNLLLGLEEQGFAPASPEEYRKAKYYLVSSGSFPTPLGEECFRYLAPEDIWELGLCWLDGCQYPNDPDTLEQTLQVIVKALKTLDSALGNTLEQILNPPPPPKAKWEIPYAVYSHWDEFPPLIGTEFSPSGVDMVYHDAWWIREDDDNHRTYWVNLKDQETVLKLDGIWSRHWTADGSRLALSSEDEVMIYSTEQVKKLRQAALPEGTRVLGWQDQKTLLLAGLDNAVIKLDIGSGKQTAAAASRHKPSLTATGKVGTTWIEGGKLLVDIDGEVKEYSTDIEDGFLLTWLPGDRGLIWTHLNNYQILNFSQGSWSSFYLPGVSLCSSWRGDREVYALARIQEFPPAYQVLIFNIGTGELTPTGIRTNSPISNSHVFSILDTKLAIYQP